MKLPLDRLFKETKFYQNLKEDLLLHKKTLTSC